MNTIALDDINWHDSLILYVRLMPERDRVEMRLLYPEEWRSNTFSEQTVIFEDAYGIPLHTSPRLLNCKLPG